MIGIRREDKNPWERRVPLSPEHVAKLTREHGIRFVVEPSSIRVFGDEEYDMLTGSSGLDWFFFDFDEDKATDQKNAEKKD